MCKKDIFMLAEYFLERIETKLDKNKYLRKIIEFLVKIVSWDKS
jgi:hypothetical protein